MTSTKDTEAIRKAIASGYVGMRDKIVEKDLEFGVIECKKRMEECYVASCC
jgi:hypothetical protein